MSSSQPYILIFKVFWYHIYCNLYITINKMYLLVLSDDWFAPECSPGQVCMEDQQLPMWQVLSFHATNVVQRKSKGLYSWEPMSLPSLPEQGIPLPGFIFLDLLSHKKKWVYLGYDTKLDLVMSL